MHGWNGKWSWSSVQSKRRYIVEVPCYGGLQINCDFGFASNVNNTIPSNTSGGANVTWTVPTATTNCPGGGVTIEQVSGFPPGSFFSSSNPTHTIQYRITDACFNEEFCTLTFSVENEQPSITCPADITVTATSAQGAQVFYDNATVVTPPGCGSNPLQVFGLPSGSIFPIGTSTVSFANTFPGSQTCNVNGVSCDLTITVNPFNGGGSGCPPSISGFTSIGEFGTSKYFLSDTEMAPVDAQNIAAVNGGHLAAILSLIHI